MAKKQTKNRREEQILSLYTSEEKPTLDLKSQKKKTPVKTPPVIKRRAFLFKDILLSLSLSATIVLFQLVLGFLIKNYRF